MKVTWISTLTEARDAAADLFALIIPSSSADPTSVPTSSDIVFRSIGETLLLDAAEADDDEDESSFESDSSLSESDSDPLSEV